MATLGCIQLIDTRNLSFSEICPAASLMNEIDMLDGPSETYHNASAHINLGCSSSRKCTSAACKLCVISILFPSTQTGFLNVRSPHAYKIASYCVLCSESTTNKRQLIGSAFWPGRISATLKELLLGSRSYWYTAALASESGSAFNEVMMRDRAGYDTKMSKQCSQGKT